MLVVPELKTVPEVQLEAPTRTLYWPSRSACHAMVDCVTPVVLRYRLDIDSKVTPPLDKTPAKGAGKSWHAANPISI